MPGPTRPAAPRTAARTATNRQPAAPAALVDGERAGREAAEVRRLAVAALDEVREAVHGYRTVDLREQLEAVERVLRSSGVRSTVVPPDSDLCRS
jgi:two-component system, NarL family, sensor histidine kinase DesK